jgi:hypothetical protein
MIIDEGVVILSEAKDLKMRGMGHGPRSAHLEILRRLRGSE